MDPDYFTFETVIILIILSLIGLGFVWVGLSNTLRISRYKKTCTEKTTGHVVNIEKIEEDSTYFPVFQYVANGQHINHKSLFGTSRTKFKIGDEVTVLYNPANVDEHYVEEDKKGNNGGIVFLVFGVLMSISVIILIFLVGHGLVEVI